MPGPPITESCDPANLAPLGWHMASRGLSEWPPVLCNGFLTVPQRDVSSTPDPEERPQHQHASWMGQGGVTRVPARPWDGPQGPASSWATTTWHAGLLRGWLGATQKHTTVIKAFCSQTI